MSGVSAGRVAAVPGAAPRRREHKMSEACWKVNPGDGGLIIEQLHFRALCRGRGAAPSDKDGCRWRGSKRTYLLLAALALGAGSAVRDGLARSSSFGVRRRAHGAGFVARAPLAMLGARAGWCNCPLSAGCIRRMWMAWDTIHIKQAASPRVWGRPGRTPSGRVLYIWTAEPPHLVASWSKFMDDDSSRSRLGPETQLGRSKTTGSQTPVHVRGGGPKLSQRRPWSEETCLSKQAGNVFMQNAWPAGCTGRAPPSP